MPWHDRLTCDEYDEMLRDPDGFRSAIDRDDEEARELKQRQEEEDEAIAREIDQRERQVEQDRQTQMHEEQLRRARAEQKAEAKRQREELEKSQRREALKKRHQEETASLRVIQGTTKPCPGCRWPIEKNAGCAHMTCKFNAHFIASCFGQVLTPTGTQCSHQFCWNCMGNWIGHRSPCV